MLTYDQWETAEKPSFPSDDETKGALAVLAWAYREYGDDIVYACSFGIEGIGPGLQSEIRRLGALPDMAGRPVGRARCRGCGLPGA